MCVKALEALRERYIELRDAGADYAALAGDVVIVDIEGYARDPKTGANVPHARRLTSHEERERERERETPPRLSGPWRAREGLFSLSRRKKERKEWPVEGIHAPLALSARLSLVCGGFRRRTRERAIARGRG